MGFKVWLICSAGLLSGMAACQNAAPIAQDPVAAFQYTELSYEEAEEIFPGELPQRADYEDFKLAKAAAQIDFPLANSSQFRLRAGDYCVRGIYIAELGVALDRASLDGKYVSIVGGMEGGIDSFVQEAETFSFIGHEPSKLGKDIPDCDDFFASFLALEIATVP